MKKLKTTNADLLKTWLTVDVLEAMNDAKSRIESDLSALTAEEVMWLNRYQTYRAELIRRNAYVARSY